MSARTKDDPALAVKCPSCAAEPGKRCLWPNEFGDIAPSQVVHAARRLRAKEATR